MTFKINLLRDSASEVGGYEVGFSMDGVEQPIAHIHEGMTSKNAKLLLAAIGEYIEGGGKAEIAVTQDEVIAQMQAELEALEEKAKQSKQDKIEQLVKSGLTKEAAEILA